VNQEQQARIQHQIKKLRKELNQKSINQQVGSPYVHNQQRDF
jgi:hypothetical protein